MVYNVRIKSSLRDCKESILQIQKIYFIGITLYIQLRVSAFYPNKEQQKR